MKTSKKLIAIIVVLSLALSVAACGSPSSETADSPVPEAVQEGSGAAKVFPIGYVDPENVNCHYTYFVEYLNEELQKNCGGAIQFEAYPNGMLGTEIDMLNALADGSLAAGCITIEPFASLIPSFQLFSLPYLFNYPEQFVVLTENEEFFSQFTDILKEEWGIQVLSSPVLSGPRMLISKEPVNSIEDVKDLTLRITTSKVFQANWSALGASPTVIPYADIFTSLQTGVLDAVETCVETCWYAGYYGAATNICYTNVVDCLGLPMMSDAFWNTLTEEEQGWIMEASQKAVERQWQRLAESEEECLQFMAEKAGVQVTDIDLAPFKEATRSVHTQFAEEIGPELIQQAYDLLDVDNAEKGYELWSDIFG